MATHKNIELLKRALSTPNIDVPLPEKRMRRLRRTEGLRAMVRETQLSVDDFIYPMFIEENTDERTPIQSMPGIFRETEKSMKAAIKEAGSLGIKATAVFGISHNKDATGSDTLEPNGLAARMVKEVKDTNPDMMVIADVCFCEYTDHGHCGTLDHNHDVDNDRTLENLCLQALNVCEAGADILAPSGMMDGYVVAIRHTLDENGYGHIPIMAYAAKFASAYYGPFREAAGCSLGKGNRKTYQMDPANGREAIREVLQDEAEGADILMVKPGLAYLDILSRMREVTDLPLAAYHVSGEYAMLKYAAEAGAINYDDVMLETLLSFKRAGADMILTYCSLDAAKALQK